MRITLLGTNGWYDTPTGNTPCVLIQARDFDIILDAGYGFSKLDAYLEPGKPAMIFLSHFHLDHLIGLHTLAKFNFPGGLHIYAQTGARDALNTLLSPVFTVPFSRLKFPLTIHELNEGVHSHPLPFTTLPLIHSVPCLGYRFEVDGRTVTYCTDTGYCENAVLLAQDADLLLTECSLSPGTDSDPGWPHLNPHLAAKIARESGAKRLVLTHFDPYRYTGLNDRDDAEAEARSLFPMTTAGRDGMVFTL